MHRRRCSSNNTRVGGQFEVQRFPAVTAAAADGSTPPLPAHPPAWMKKQLGKGRALETGNENAPPPPPDTCPTSLKCFFAGAAGDQSLGSNWLVFVSGLISVLLSWITWN